MMEGIRQYVLSVLCSAVICAVVNVWLEEKGTQGAIIKLISGVFMSLSLVAPVFRLEMGDITGYFDQLSVNADAAVEAGENMALATKSEIIKSRAEAYILDKAAFWELNLMVEVTLSGSDPPVPESVVLKGDAPAYARNQLKKCIAHDLGIPEERQEWT